MPCRNSQRVSSEVSKVRGSGAPRKMLEIELFFYSCAIYYMQKNVESIDVP
jgi:hypothetical protein